MLIQLNLQHIGMQLDGAEDAFYSERKAKQPDTDMLGQIVEDYRDELDKLESQVHSLRHGLRRMETALDVIESSET